MLKWRVRIGVTSFVFVFTRTITFRKLSFVRYVEASEGAGARGWDKIAPFGSSMWYIVPWFVNDAMFWLQMYIFPVCTLIGALKKD